MWDEQVQANYWYNRTTGEAKWTEPEAEPSYDQSSYDQSAYAYDQSGYDQSGYDQSGYDQGYY